MSPSQFRFAVVEDLQLSPALVLASNTTVGQALQWAFEREFSILPISEPSTRNLIGWLSADKLKDQVSRGEADEELTLAELDSRGSSSVSKFAKSKKYQVITPDTPLEELDAFFKASSSTFALVTDASRKFVLGVVTPEDLQKFVSRRGI